MFTKIHMETWNRRFIYAELSHNEPLFFSLTANVDISLFMKKIRRNAAKFFPNLLFGISFILNEHQEFKMGLNETGELGFYDAIHPCHVLFHAEEEIISLCYTEFNPDPHIFFENYSQDLAKYAHKPFDPKPLNRKNIFHISNVPWLSFTSVTLRGKNHYTQLTPLFTLGKYFEDHGKLLLPIAIHANHAVVDGFHVARFYSELQLWLDSP